jgi:hypothetical protein
VDTVGSADGDDVGWGPLVDSAGAGVAVRVGVGAELDSAGERTAGDEAVTVIKAPNPAADVQFSPMTARIP